MAAPVIGGYWFGEAFARRVRNHNRVMLRRQRPCRARIGVIFVSIPPYCNLACPYCYTSSRNRATAPALSKWELKRIISVAAEHGAASIVVAGEGEPFLSSDIWTIIDAATSRHMQSVVFTNGTTITKQVARRLFGESVSIILKLNSLKAHMLDRLVGVAGAHRAVFAGLDALLSAGYQAPRLGLQSAIMKPNLSDLVDVFVFCRTHNIVPYIETYVAMGRGAAASVREALEPSGEEVRRLFCELRRLDRERFGIEWPLGGRVRVAGYGTCNKSLLALTVASNGDVYRCVTETGTLGNIRETDIEEILRAPRTLRTLACEQCQGCASEAFRITRRGVERRLPTC